MCAASEDIVTVAIFDLRGTLGFHRPILSDVIVFEQIRIIPSLLHR